MANSGRPVAEGLLRAATVEGIRGAHAAPAAMAALEWPPGGFMMGEGLVR